MVDYGSWVVFLVVLLATPLPFLTMGYVTLGSCVATLIIGVTAVGSLFMILMRGHGPRRLARKVAERRDGWAIAFDEAQLQDGGGVPRQEFRNGAICVDPSGEIGVWEEHGDTPVAAYSKESVVVAHSTHAYRFFCYAVIIIDLADSRRLTIRPLKPRAPSWRVGMTRRESIDAASRISGSA
jgi:hypothetical protein